MALLDYLKNPTVVWFILGILLAVLELMVPGLVLIFFGIGAWITAFVCLFIDVSIGLQIIIFTLTSLITLALLRKYLKQKFFQEETKSPDTLCDEFIGKIATAETSISPDNAGKITFKGAPWKAESEDTINAGDRVEIIGKESITLFVKLIK